MRISLDGLANIYVFGDSLSDTGNFLTFTSEILMLEEPIPPPPYFEGRFSNGPVAVDYLVNKLNTGDSKLNLALAPSLLGGNNFSFAGAGTGRNNSNDDDLNLDLPGLLDQIDAYRQLDIASKNSVFFVWAGPTDFLDNLAGSNVDDPAVLIEQGVDNQLLVVEKLSSTGARQFVIPNMPNLGRLPASAEFQREARAITIAYNGRLGLSLDSLELNATNADLEIVEVDLFGLGEKIAQDPTRFGFTNTTDPLLPLVASGQALTNTPGFFFWDEFHPTTQAHELFGDTIFNTLTGDIPQPVFNDILGTPYQDFLFGTRAADNIDGLAGNDLIFGLAGGDLIEGWQGRDRLFGNSGDDTIDGGVDQDSVWGGTGHDLVFGGAGDDRLSGNWGNDILIGDDDADLIWGNQGHDDILGGTGDDKIWGNTGEDFIHGGDGHDSLLGGSGADKLVGGNGDDWVIGGSGNDVFVSGPGQDTLVGGLGDDTVLYQGTLTDFIFKGGPDHFQVVGASGTHILKEIEYLELSGQQIAVNTLPYLPAPLFSEVEQIETVIPSSGDVVDIFVPVGSSSSPPAKSLPVALLLQGANVDKSNYEEYAEVVASYGFVVVVPNNLNTFMPPPPAPPITGYFSELQQINEVLDFIQDPAASPVTEVVNPEQLVLLGHSIGGVAGLNAVRGGCTNPCPFGEFEQPEELVGAIFYGTNLRNFDGTFPPIDNGTIPTALILGENDGRALPVNTVETYEQIENPPKALVSVAGANHFGITDINAPSNPASTPAEVPPIIQDPNTQTIPQHVSIDSIGTWSALFLRATVLEDPVAIDFVFSGAGDQIDTNVDVITENPSNLFMSNQTTNMGFSSELSA